MSAGPPAWMREALCAEVGGDLWFPGLAEPHVVSAAKRVCNGRPGVSDPCPVRTECLEYALDNYERDGIFGGMTPRERRRQARLRRRGA